MKENEMQIERLLSNGNWIAFEQDIELYLHKALVIEQRIAANLNKPAPESVDVLRIRLQRGGKIQYGTDWNEQLRGVIAEIVETVETTTTADCGHTIRKDAVMHASLGTACPNCYDSLSDGVRTYIVKKTMQYECEAGHSVREPLRAITLHTGIMLMVCQACYNGEMAEQRYVRD